MKTYIVYLVIGLVAINSLSAQVKIGDNPQNLNPASLLELQSSNRVLVITRVTDAQMSGISPLPGAVVYNTDQGCLHYYNGTEWINICEELDNSFTVSTRADSLQQVNPQARDNTIAILESINPDGSTNYNFEVNRITGANIVDTSINASLKLQDRSITNNKLADKSVGLRNLADATNTGDLLMYNGTAWNFVNRTDLLNTQLDSIVGNEVVGPTDATLLLNGAGSQADPLTLDVAEGGITAFEIATGAVTTDEILNGTLLTEDISDDAVTTVKISDGAVTNAKLDKANIPLSGFGPAGANVSMGSFQINDLLNPTLDTDAANKLYVDNEIAASNQTIVSADLPNSITAGSDGGALYDDTALQTAVSDNATDISNNTTAIAAKEDSANKSTDAALGTSDVLFPTQNAVKSYVDTEVAASNQTIVSADLPNSITAGSDGGALYDDTALQTAVSDNATDITNNTTAIAAKEDSANKSSDAALGTSDVLFPTQNAVKSYVDTEVAASNQTIVSADLPNSITAGSDGGALYDDTALQTAVSDNATDITNNTTAIAAKEDSANKSTDAALGTSDVLFPTQNAVKSYVDTEVAASNQTIVSADLPNSITAGSDGGALYDDTALQTAVSDNATDISNNTTAIAAKEDSANKSTDTALGTSDVLFPTQNAVKSYVDTEVAASNQTIVSADLPNSITAGTDGGAYLNATIKPINTTDVDISLDETHYTIILENPSTSYINGVTLPNTASVGRIYVVRNNSGVTVPITVNLPANSPVSQIIDGTAIWLQYDGTTWYQIN